MKVRQPLLIAMAAAALAAGTLTIPTASSQDETPAPCQESRAPVLCQTQQHRLEVWRLQRVMSLPLTRTTYSDRREHASTAYREWVRALWAGRLERVRATYAEWKATIAAASIEPNSTWLALANCETGTTWSWYNSQYEGAYGFTHDAWDQWRHSSHPYTASEATPGQQTWVATAILNDVGWGAWPACSIRLGLR